MTTKVQFLGGKKRGKHPKSLGKQKRAKIGAILNNFRFLTQIPLKRIEKLKKIGIADEQLQFFLRWTKKLGEILSTNKKVASA